MRVQTYASWQHQQVVPVGPGIAPQSLDNFTGVIDTLIAQMTYCPSFVIQITPDAEGLLLRGAQRVVQTEEQRDGMVLLRTQAGQVWITRADYHRLAVA
jgi:hypothetical protein